MVTGTRTFNPLTKRYGATVYEVHCSACGWHRDGFATEARALQMLAEHGPSCQPHRDVKSPEVTGPKAVIVRESDDVWVVKAIYGGVDRPQGHATSVRSRRDAERFAAAIDAGVAFDPPTVCVDVAGQSYVNARCHVWGRTLNADLRRLGY